MCFTIKIGMERVREKSNRHALSVLLEAEKFLVSCGRYRQDTL